MLFDWYLFADYSGAQSASAQRRNIRLAEATRGNEASIVEARFSRDDLGDALLQRLRAATAQGKRVIFGQDHQYGLPASLLTELGIRHLSWRALLRVLVAGSYGEGAPALRPPHEFGRMLNRWLIARGHPPYFYSATKALRYGVPGQNPRPNDQSLYRLTERRHPHSGRGTPKAFNRIGDNGTVGGQTLLGLLQVERLLRRCEADGIRVAVWPFDGLSLDLSTYEGAHVMIEPYPTAVRGPGVAQSDAADALACADEVRSADHSGHLSRLLDLTSLTSSDAELAQIEGWIASHRPALPHSGAELPPHAVAPGARPRSPHSLRWT